MLYPLHGAGDQLRGAAHDLDLTNSAFFVDQDVQQNLARDSRLPGPRMERQCADQLGALRIFCNVRCKSSAVA